MAAPCLELPEKLLVPFLTAPRAYSAIHHSPGHHLVTVLGIGLLWDSKKMHDRIESIFENTLRYMKYKLSRPESSTGAGLRPTW